MMSPTSSSSSDDDNDENRLDSSESQLLASQKSLIYKHPLFPVLVYVLERCEQATLNPSLLSNHDESSSSFEQNLKIFLSKNPTILNNPNGDLDENTSMIDNFYIDAMQVLRIHLLELDKVNDLCRDFCQRYIACLKVKLNANNIFTDDEDDEDEDEFEEDQSNLDEEFDSSEENDHDHRTDNDSLLFATKDNLREQPFGKQSISNDDAQYSTLFNGQTPLSQILASGSAQVQDPSSLLFDSFCSKRRKASNLVSTSSKRGVLPKSATSIMRSWLFQHIVHPYPTEDEKRAISHKTNLSLLQVNNWFINARRRILQPMLEASNPDLVANKKKKRQESTSDDQHQSSQHRQMSNINRYWPSNLVQFDLTTSDQRKK